MLPTAWPGSQRCPRVRDASGNSAMALITLGATLGVARFPPQSREAMYGGLLLKTLGNKATAV